MSSDYKYSTGTYLRRWRLVIAIALAILAMVVMRPKFILIPQSLYSGLCRSGHYRLFRLAYCLGNTKERLQAVEPVLDYVSTAHSEEAITLLEYLAKDDEVGVRFQVARGLSRINYTQANRLATYFLSDDAYIVVQAAHHVLTNHPYSSHTELRSGIENRVSNTYPETEPDAVDGTEGEKTRD